MPQMQDIVLHPAARPTGQDVACVMSYLYESTRLSQGPIKAVMVEANHTTSGAPRTWGHTVTTTWDGTTGLIYSPSDTWLTHVYFDMNGDLGAEPSVIVNRSVSRVATLYHETWRYWPKLSWSWTRTGQQITWTLTFKQKYGSRSVSATFDDKGTATAATSAGTEWMPGTGTYAASMKESFAPYTGPPISVE
jgi:hypothetical protein